MKRFLTSVVILLITFSCFSQELDVYKYVVIPYEFDFLNKHDKYRVNTLTRYLFKNEGFEVLYDNEEFPKELADNRCLGLYLGINNDSGIFTTKMSYILRDCSNQVLMETSQGRSRIKAYEKSYNQALRRAFTDIEAKNYSYQPTKQVVPETVVETVTETVPTEKVYDKVKVTVREEPTPVHKVVERKGTETIVTETTNAVLYAQPIKNGYQLVDSTPKIVMILLKTGAPNVYIVKGQDASLYKENGKWMLSKATNEGNAISTLNIRF